MIIGLKIALGVIFVLMLLYACFKSFERTSERKKLLLFIGIIPYAIASLIIFKYLISSVFANSQEADSISTTYSGIFLFPYLIGLIRILFNTGFANAGNRLFDQNNERNKYFKNTSKLIFSFHSIAFFIGGLIIITGISINEIPNDNYKEVKSVRKEKWLYVSNDFNKLNEISNHFYNLSTKKTVDTISFVLNEEDQSGWMINKGDSLSIKYFNFLTELELERGNKIWRIKVASYTESEMWIELFDGTKQELIREK
jgi:hypothetical protein